METRNASQLASVQEDYVFVRPGMTAREIVQAVRNLRGVCLTSVSMRDSGQSDFKNRHWIYDLKTLAPMYNRMGLFSAECHGGARWHVGIMNRRESPFEEIRILRQLMPNVLLQTLVRETNLWGYRPYPRNVIEYAVSQVDIDVWRCFSFLNDVRNMRAVAEVVMKRGRLFEPAISFTVADWATDAYYLGVVHEIVALAGGVDEIILCIKDMAGVGNPVRIGQLVATIKEHYPDLLIHYHRHVTDGLAVPALFAAAQAGAKIVDVQEDALVRFYGHPPILGVQAYFEEGGIHVHLNRPVAEQANQQVREWIGHYEWAESPFKGYDHGVTKHRMPGGAFPSSFEQAEKGGFLHLMPAILRVMSLYNQIVRYFDLFRNASGDFKNLLVGGYGRLPVGWPADWVYQSAFGDEWQEKIQARTDLSPLDTLKDDNLDKLRQTLSEAIGREPTEEEFILYLMHPKDALSFIEFRERYGMAPLVLPTNVWRNGLRRSGDKVDFELDGKPYCIELVSIGAEHEGVIHVVLKVNNVTRVYPVATPRAKKAEIRMAKGPNEIGAPINGNVWRIGNPQRGPIHVGDVVHKGEEVANLEAMKMENAVLAPFSGRIAEVCIKLNDVVKEGQLLFVLEKKA